MSLSAKAKNEIMKMETYAKFPYLIEITRFYTENEVEKTEILRYANCDEDVTFENKIFSDGYFEISPPEKNTKEISDAKLTISAIDQSWITKIRQTERRAKIRFIASIQYQENSIESIEPIDDILFELMQAQWNESTIQWTMEFDNLLDVNIPCEELSSLNCPQLG